MANISEYISKIRTAIYGKDVRGALADGLDAVNKETEATTTLAQEIEQRQTSIERSLFSNKIIPVDLDLENKQNDYDTLVRSIYDNRVFIPDIPITDEGLIDIKIKATLASTTKFFLLTKNADNSFNIIQTQDVSLIAGINNVETSFKTDGINVFYVGIQASSTKQNAYFMTTNAPVGHYRSTAWDGISNVLTLDYFDATIGIAFYPILIEANTKQLSDRIDEINDILFDSYAPKKLDLTSPVFNTLVYAEQSGKIFIPKIPLNQSGKVTINVLSKASSQTTVFLMKDNGNNTFDIVDFETISLSEGINSVETSMKSDGSGQYIGILGDRSKSNLYFDLNYTNKIGLRRSYAVWDGTTLSNLGFDDEPYDIAIYPSTNSLSSKLEIVSKDIEIIKNESGGNYKGKYLSILGDSISTFAGWIPSGNEAFYDGSNYGVSSVDQTWWKRLLDQTGMNLCVNNAWSGSRVTTTAGDTSAGCMARATSLHTDDHDPDIIIVYLGINDFNNNVEIGNYDGSQEFPTVTTTFREAYAIMLDKILIRYPKAEVYVCTLPYDERTGATTFPESNGNGILLATWNKAIRELADLFGVNIIEFSKSGLTHQNGSLFMGDYDNATGRFLHPNAAGHRLLANKAIKTIDPIAKYSVS